MLHLIRRFFGFLTAKPLSPGDQVFVARWLIPDLQRLFYRQRVEDQRHAVTVAMRVGDRPHLIEAALMHDIGKTTIRLGAFSRSFATLWAFTSLPIWGEWLTYIDHGPIGATLLEQSGAGDLAIVFARYHPGTAPAGFNIGDWEALEQADAA
jgi:hypothetical protein